MSAEFDLIKRAFKDALARSGIPVRNAATNVTRRCVSGAFDLNTSQQLIAMLGSSHTKVDMLSDDFDALDLTANVSKVKFVTGIAEIDGAVFTVMNFVRDPQDPAVHFLVLAEQG